VQWDSIQFCDLSCYCVTSGISLSVDRIMKVWFLPKVLESFLFIAGLICIISSPTNLTLNVKVRISQLWNVVFFVDKPSFKTLCCERMIDHRIPSRASCSVDPIRVCLWRMTCASANKLPLRYVTRPDSAATFGLAFEAYCSH
jgi:hypothetical protein